MINTLKYLTIAVLILIMTGCKKVNNVNVNDLIGKYEGDYNNLNGWTLYSPTITKIDNNTVLIDYWPSGEDSIEIKINGSELEIEEQVFRVLRNSGLGDPNGPYFFYLNFKLSASGTFQNDNIKLSYKEEMRYDSQSEYTFKDSGTVDINKIY